MLSNIGASDKKVILNFIFNFLRTFNPDLPRSSPIFKEYNKGLADFRTILSEQIDKGVMNRRCAESLFVTLILIRRNRILRLNVLAAAKTECNT